MDNNSFIEKYINNNNKKLYIEFKYSDYYVCK